MKMIRAVPNIMQASPDLDSCPSWPGYKSILLIELRALRGNKMYKKSKNTEVIMPNVINLVIKSRFGLNMIENSSCLALERPCPRF